MKHLKVVFRPIIILIPVFMYFAYLVSNAYFEIETIDKICINEVCYKFPKSWDITREKKKKHSSLYNSEVYNFFIEDTKSKVSIYTSNVDMNKTFLIKSKLVKHSDISCIYWESKNNQKSSKLFIEDNQLFISIHNANDKVTKMLLNTFCNLR